MHLRLTPQELIDQLKADLEKIVVTEGCDRGVVLLSQEAPLVYSQKHKCDVYVYECFSPLGTALVALWDKIKENTDL